MNEELEIKLVKKYPKLFSQVGMSEQESCMAWGCSCGDGWYTILEELCEKLKDMPISFAQIKEKFGTLRVYFDVDHKRAEELTDEKEDALWAFLREAEEKSAKTCEACGKPGKAREGGWIKVLCDICYEARESRRSQKRG